MDEFSIAFALIFSMHKPMNFVFAAAFNINPLLSIHHFKKSGRRSVVAAHESSKKKLVKD